MDTELIKSYNIDERDYEYKIKNISLPPEYSLIPKLPPIKNQGREGSCLAYVLSDVKAYHETIESGSETAIDYHPQFIYQRRKNKGEGMSTRYGFKLLRDVGMLPCKEYEKLLNIQKKSKKKKQKQNIEKMFIEHAKNFQIDGYVKASDVQSIKEGIFQFGVCVCIIPIYNYSKKQWIKDDGQKLLGFHAVSLVGYSDKQQSFIVRNSWGEGWGTKGYSVMHYDEIMRARSFYFCIDKDTDEVRVSDFKKSYMGDVPKKRDKRKSLDVLELDEIIAGDRKCCIIM